MRMVPESSGHGSDEDITRIVNDMVRQRLKTDPFFNDKGLAEIITKLGPLGLKLNTTPELVRSIEMSLNERSRSGGGNGSDISGAGEERRRYEEKEKLKASNFPAELLRIGSWKVVAENEGDLVAKCYFAKQKLVWEILGTTPKLKRKIEIQWSDISAIRATMVPNQPGVLEIELNKRPTFAQEKNPQPRKHTIWSPTTDFTDGQAVLYRRHYLKFPPGALDKHYDKILQADTRLLMLSQQPFPSHSSPYFPEPSRDFSLDFSIHRSDFAAPVWPLKFMAERLQGMSSSPNSVIDYLSVDDGGAASRNGGYRFSQNQRTDTRHWIGTEGQIQVQQQPTITNMSSHMVPNQDHQAMEQFYPELSSIAARMNAEDSQTGFDLDQRTCIDRVNSLQNLINFPNGSNLASTGSHQFGSNGGIYTQRVDFLPPRATNDLNPMLDPPFVEDSWMDCTRH